MKKWDFAFYFLKKDKGIYFRSWFVSRSWLWSNHTSACSLTQVWQAGLAQRETVSDMLLVGMCFTSHLYAPAMMDSTHTHTFISTGRDVPDIGHTRHKWSTVPEEYVTVSWFIHVVSNLSLLFSCFKGETSAPLLPFSFCKHSTALLHMILKLLIKHNTKDYPWLTSTNNMAWVYLIRLINMFLRFREVRLVQHQWM